MSAQSQTPPPGVDLVLALNDLLGMIMAHPRYPQASNQPMPAEKAARNARGEFNILNPSTEVPHPSQKLWHVGDFVARSRGLAMEGDVQEGAQRCMMIEAVCKDDSAAGAAKFGGDDLRVPDDIRDKVKEVVRIAMPYMF